MVASSAWQDRTGAPISRREKDLDFLTEVRSAKSQGAHLWNHEVSPKRDRQRSQRAGEPPTAAGPPSPCSDRLWVICSEPTAAVDAGALELLLRETPVPTAGTASAMTAPARKASKPPAAAVPTGTVRLIIVLTFCIGLDLLVIGRALGPRS